MASQVTVTGTLNDPSGTALQGNAFVRFILRQFQGFVPQVQGTSIIVEPQIDALPNSSGQISQALWPNNEITPSTTFYEVEFWDQGRITSRGNYLINGATDLNTAAQLNAPPVPPGFELVLQNNGADNSSQSTLNLTNSDDSIVIDDLGNGNIQLSAQSSGFATPGYGGFWGAGLPISDVYGAAIAGGGTISTTANQITAIQFTLFSPFTISSVSARVTAGVSTATMNFGVYSIAGNKLLDSGAMAAASSSSSPSNAITPVTLPVGTYYFAQSADHTGVQVMAFSLGNTAMADLINANGSIKIGQATNSTSSGVMPATLGTISADSIYPNMAGAFFGV